MMTLMPAISSVGYSIGNTGRAACGEARFWVTTVLFMAVSSAITMGMPTLGNTLASLLQVRCQKNLFYKQLLTI